MMSRLPAPLRRWLRPRRLLATGLAGVALVAVLLGGAVGWVHLRAHGHLYYSVAAAPSAPVALVFGAEVYQDDTPSPFLTGRLELARRLFVAGKVRALLVTGDHRRWGYDEPDVMRAWLVDHGVPMDRIVTDYAGFDTYQSCARAKRIFGVHRALVVSQDFHVPRATALCRSVGIDADGVGDTGQHRWDAYPRNWVREQLADVKAIYSMVMQPDPEFLGRREHGVERAVR
ncbi:SanA/YdcF family protein [Actinocatenispora thailandica]|nr:ElyC/SanA/YdcF family protein [Actinocatenispora thailandica]